MTEPALFRNLRERRVRGNSDDAYDLVIDALEAEHEARMSLSFRFRRGPGGEEYLVVFDEGWRQGEKIAAHVVTATSKFEAAEVAIEKLRHAYYEWFK